jgi:hypothetical protein
MFASDKNPVQDNRDGTYLTMWSTNGLIFGICNIVGNFGAVFVDNAYWQNAMAARPSGTYKGSSSRSAWAGSTSPWATSSAPRFSPLPSP